MFYRTIRMLEHGIKPVYVFDGKPPQLKSSEVTELIFTLILFAYLSLVFVVQQIQLLLFGFYLTAWKKRGEKSRSWEAARSSPGNG